MSALSLFETFDVRFEGSMSVDDRFAMSTSKRGNAEDCGRESVRLCLCGI